MRTLGRFPHSSTVSPGVCTAAELPSRPRMSALRWWESPLLKSLGIGGIYEIARDYSVVGDQITYLANERNRPMAPSLKCQDVLAVVYILFITIGSLRSFSWFVEISRDMIWTHRVLNRG